jgi:hypothetical protein
LKYIKNNAIDIVRWNNCIAQSNNRLPYAFSWYLDAVFPGWDAVVEENYKAVFPLVIRKKYGIYYIFQPYFIQQLGIFSTVSLDENMVDEFIAAIPPFVKLVRINLNYSNKSRLFSHTISLLTNLELNLAVPYEKIYKNYSENTRRNIKKANTNGLFIQSTESPETIISLFRKNRGSTIEKMNDTAYNKLRLLLQTACQHAKVSLKEVYTSDNVLCAGTILLSDGGRNIFIFSAVNALARKNGAMSFLIDHWIQEKAGQVGIFDFEGSNNAQLARFYKGFGATEIFYPHLEINRLNPILHTILRIIKH